MFNFVSVLVFKTDIRIPSKFTSDSAPSSVALMEPTSSQRSEEIQARAGQLLLRNRNHMLLISKITNNKIQTLNQLSLSLCFEI
jgi:hypothetical protein